MNFAGRVRVIPTGGIVSRPKAKTPSGSIGADEVLILFTAATDYHGFAGRNTPDPVRASQQDLAKAAAKSWAALREAPRGRLPAPV